MVVAQSKANQSLLGRLLLGALGRCFAACAIGLLLWLGMMLCLPSPTQRMTLLLLVIAWQLGFLLVAFASQRLKVEKISALHALRIGVLVMLAAALLGVLYDALVRGLGGAATLGPWGEVRRLDIWPATLLVLLGVLLGPAGDEWFFRAGLFDAWQAAKRPWSGALLSSGAFALSRLDFVNFPAYFGLGLLLCAVYRWTGSLRAVWAGHALLNAAMLVLLFAGYE